MFETTTQSFSSLKLGHLAPGRPNNLSLEAQPAACAVTPCRSMFANLVLTLLHQGFSTSESMEMEEQLHAA